MLFVFVWLGTSREFSVAGCVQQENANNQMTCYLLLQAFQDSVFGYILQYTYSAEHLQLRYSIHVGSWRSRIKFSVSPKTVQYKLKNKLFFQQFYWLKFQLGNALTPKQKCGTVLFKFSCGFQSVSQKHLHIPHTESCFSFLNCFYIIIINLPSTLLHAHII